MLINNRCRRLGRDRVTDLRCDRERFKELHCLRQKPKAFSGEDRGGQSRKRRGAHGAASSSAPINIERDGHVQLPLRISDKLILEASCQIIEASMTAVSW